MRGSTPEGTPWGPFTLHEELGRGRFGRVHRAWDPSRGADVALKIFDRHDSRGHALHATIFEESRLLAQLVHPNLVRIHGAHIVDGEAAVAMEMIRGESVADIVGQRGPVRVDEAAMLGRAVCRALAALHAAGFLHRDVKAQNVVREAAGRYVLMDIGEGRATNRIPAGVLVGTPAYLAPEVLEGQPATPRADLYSLGVLLYYSVTGHFPVVGEPLDVLRAAHRGGRRRLADTPARLPGPFVDAVDRALAPDPGSRFRDAGEFENALF